MTVWNDVARTLPQRGGSGDRIRSLTSRSFESLVLRGAGPIAVEFMSYGCAHCRAIEPIVQRIVDLESARVTLYRVNIAVEPELALSHDVRGTPTFVLFLDGREVGRTEGVRPTLPDVLAAVTGAFA